MAEHFPMGAYSAFPPYGFNMPMQTANGMYQMPPQTTMPMGSMTMPTPPGFGQPPQMQAVPKPKKKAKATPKKVRRAHLVSAGEREARGFFTRPDGGRRRSCLRNHSTECRRQPSDGQAQAIGASDVLYRDGRGSNRSEVDSD